MQISALNSAYSSPLRFGKKVEGSLGNKLALLQGATFNNGTLTTTSGKRQYAVTVKDTHTKEATPAPIKSITLSRIGGKECNTASGVVWATFVTQPDGKLISAAIQKTELDSTQRDSLNPLVNRILGK